MALKLFRSTGYSSILMAGETRLAMHPGWMILAVSAWAGFACNVALWRQLAGTGAGMGSALALALSVAGASAAIVSLCGWRKTIKPTATLVVLAAALSACTIWSEGRSVDAALLGHGMAGLLLPSWPSLFRWPFWALLAGLALLPMMWMWSTPLRRLSAQRQLNVNIVGALIGAAILGIGSWLLLNGPA
ncbi:MAG: phosphoethanolamine transferase domain-containing protein [Ramlibacter sp.]